MTMENQDTSLKFARKLSEVVSKLWKQNNFICQTTQITQDLLNYWFLDSFCEQRKYNFHIGQKQAILNTIFLHEISNTHNILDMYKLIDESLVKHLNAQEINSPKYSHPKYAMKMATGSGKTWVMEAFIIWQYLNAKAEEHHSGKYSKNFLIVAPGLIVYERLLAGFLGKETESGIRSFETSDFFKYGDLFIPNAYRDLIFNFIQNSAADKNNIGNKITGEGVIAITNWHSLSCSKSERRSNSFSQEDTPEKIVRDLIPISSVTTPEHSLDELDKAFLKNNKLGYLSQLEDIVVMNDEAHHIHTVKNSAEVIEVEWQKSLDEIAYKKGEKFVQFDFSATPYNNSGNTNKHAIKQFFPHIIVDFNLHEAIRRGLVKTVVLDRRKELSSEKLKNLDFKAVRDGNTVIGLSEGQKIMLRAGIQKLKLLEKQFIAFSKDKYNKSNKHPKMLVMCEDTKVSPYVVDYLTEFEGLDIDDIVKIDSKAEEISSESEWKELKKKLFNIDCYSKPSVIVSVLMLREGFDVNNICVIVPLRSNESEILLEQTIGRGLRLMWKESEYYDIKQENIANLFKNKHEPSNYLDILSIIEHPKFIEFYDEFIKDDLVYESDKLPMTKEDILGDLINIKLNKNYKDFDIYFPRIAQETEEIILNKKLSHESMKPFIQYSLVDLQQMVCNRDYTFYSEEITEKTRFGEYNVYPDIFNAKSYNEYISKIVSSVLMSIHRVNAVDKRFPYLQVNNAELASLIDKYIRVKLFSQSFDPFNNDNWRILLLSNSGIVDHITGEINRVIYEIQNETYNTSSKVIKRYFSEVNVLKARENYSINVTKSIYEKLPYPSNKGGLEKAFILFCDNDSYVESIIKIRENAHTFAYLNYIREDGIIASYYPDFIIKLANNIYLVETKADKDINNQNVKNKHKSAIEWISKINLLKPEDRMYCNWSYSILTDKVFYSYKSNGASIKDILKFCSLYKPKL